jgi:hypothetical protein
MPTRRQGLQHTHDAIGSSTCGAATTRREFCRFAMCGATMLGAGLISPASNAAQKLNLEIDADLLRAMVMMRGRVDSELAFGWVRAKRFAVSQGRVEPLCGFVAATFKRFRQVSDEMFEAVVLEVTHYTDFDTGELLNELVMPFSNQRVEVPVYRFGPARTRFAVRLDEKEDFAPAASTNEDDFSPAGTVLMNKSISPESNRGGTLYLRHEEHGRVYPFDSDFPTMFYKESTIWSAPIEEALDSSRASVDARVSYSAMTSWRPWMRMGDIPGHTASNGFGYKVSSISDLPEDYLGYTKQRHPDVLEDPEGILNSIGD